MNVLNQSISEKFTLYQGDCVDVLQGIPENSIHFSIFSPPFASLYTYSNSDRDMGNCKDDAESAALCLFSPGALPGHYAGPSGIGPLHEFARYEKPGWLYWRERLSWRHHPNVYRKRLYLPQ